jgi:hypothetical protein
MTDHNIPDIREQLQMQFESIAHWRREKAQQYPDDTRNAEAALMLDHLAATVADIPDDTLAAYAELFQDGDDPYHDVSEESEMMRVIGFHSAYTTATAFLKEFIKRRTGGGGNVF